MDTETDQDLSAANREELLAIIAQQRAIITELEKRIAQLEARLSGRNTPGMPGNKPASTRKKERQTTRKPRPKGFARCRATPTRKVEHKLDNCPDCGTRLKGGWVHKTRQVIEIPVAPAEVIQHELVARQCPVCNQAKVPKVELGGLVAGEQRLGINLVSLIVTLKEEARLPVRAIQWYLRTLHQLELSVGGIIELCHRVAEKGKCLVEEIRERIRASRVVQADETGWREDGKNGYVWTFSTPTERYFVRGRRSRAMVEEVLGQACQAVLVTDFYKAYDFYAGLHQRCWAHLLRDIHDLAGAYSDDQGLQKWAQAGHKLFVKAKEISAELEKRGASDEERLRAQLKLEQTLLRLCRPHLAKETALQGRLCRRITRSIKELFVFVAHPEVPPDNNAAERSLRHLVISRKISGGTRSEKGSKTKMILATLFGTWRARDLDPFAQCRLLLASP